MASRCGQDVPQQAIPARPPHPPPEQEQEYDFVEEPAREFFCAVSLELLREPQQTDCCGHHFSDDVARRLRSEGKPCPVCQRADFTTHPDIFHGRRIRQLTIRCQHKANGCGWVGELGNLGDHVTLCPKQPWKCVYCALTGLKECESDHLSVCGQYPVSCPNRCAEGEVPHSSLEQHLSLCPLQEVECEYAGMGCEVRLARREMRGHLEKEGQNHLLKMCAASLAVSRELSRRAGEREREVVELKEEVRRVREEVGEMERRVREEVGEIRKDVREGLAKMERTFEEEMKRMMEENKKRERKVVEGVTEVEGKGKKVLEPKTREKMGEVKKEVRELKEEMEQNVESRNDGRKEVKEGEGEMERKMEETRKREETKQMGSRVVEGVKGMEEINKNNMENPQSQISEIHHEVAVLIPPVEFTITNFSDLKAEAKEWRSPPFYTHHGGYKMCLGVRPNGWLIYRGSHVSVLFYKMLDPNKDNLEWGVKLPITIQCLNQTTGKWEREYTNGTNFTRGKPFRDVENSCYFAQYIPHTELAEYVKNDSFCVRITKFTVH